MTKIENIKIMQRTEAFHFWQHVHKTKQLKFHTW